MLGPRLLLTRSGMKVFPQRIKVVRTCATSAVFEVFFFCWVKESTNLSCLWSYLKKETGEEVSKVSWSHFKLVCSCEITWIQAGSWHWIYYLVVVIMKSSPSPLQVQLSVTSTCAKLFPPSHINYMSHPVPPSPWQLWVTLTMYDNKTVWWKEEEGPNVNRPRSANTASFHFFVLLAFPRTNPVKPKTRDWNIYDSPLRPKNKTDRSPQPVEYHSVPHSVRQALVWKNKGRCVSSNFLFEENCSIFCINYSYVHKQVRGTW